APKAVAALSSLVAPSPVLLHRHPPLLKLSLTLTRAGKLELALLDSKGRVLSRWSRNEKAGRRSLELVLPVKARRPGHDRVRVTVSGRTKTVPVTVRG